MRRCLIITGGTIDLDFAGSFLENERFDKVIAVDAGLERAAALGLVPDLIVGDFDTVKPEILERYRRMEHIVWDVHQPEKDETDTELALQKAQAIGSGEIAVLGATGGGSTTCWAISTCCFPAFRRASTPGSPIPRTGFT